VDRVQALRFFQAYNRERIHRLAELAPPRHKLIYELLPLLFHINSKLLPGYIDNDTPAGLIDYRPDKQALDTAKQLENSFKYRSRALRSYPLRGLYLIPPRGILSYPEQPESELWLLHADKLKPEQRQQLESKLKAVCEWAASAGLKLNATLLSIADLNAGKLSSWQCDLFYTCGMVLAGSVPYWWLSTAEEDNTYQQSMAVIQSQRLLSRVTLIDFGQAKGMDAATLFNHTAKTIENSLQLGQDLFELLYLQSCLDKDVFPVLSESLKQQIYSLQGHFLNQDISHLKLLQLSGKENFELAKQAYYLYSKEKLSQAVRQALYPWRRDFIQNLVEQWGWDKQQLRMLDSQDYTANTQLYQHIGQCCKSLLGQLQRLSQQYQLDTGQTLQKLRWLYQQRFQPAADVVSPLPAKMRVTSDSDKLYLYRFQKNKDWLLSKEILTHGSQNALFSHESLVHVLAWAVNNQLVSRSNWLSVTDENQTVTTSTVVELVQQMIRSPLQQSDLIADTATSPDAETAQQLLMFINLEHQPNDKLTQQGLQLSSKQNDPLNYTSFRHSLVTSIEGLIQSSNGLWHSFSFEGDNAVLEFLVYMLNWQPTSLDRTAISGWCPTPIFGQIITQRLVRLCAKLCQHYQQFPANGRLLINIKDRPYSLQWQQQAEFIPRPAAEGIWQTLTSNQTEFSATAIDESLDSDGLFEFLLNQQSAERISVFIYLEQSTIICYLLDELGNLVRQQFQHLTESTLIAHLQKFLTEIKINNGVEQLRFYRLSRERQNWQLHSLMAPSQTAGYLPIKVKLADTTAEAGCEISCGQKTFAGKTDDPALFTQIHQLVLSLRKQNQHYPIYLNSLEFDDDLYHPAAFYMQQKQRLEQLFNPD
jgi:adenylate cyclase class 1